MQVILRSRAWTLIFVATVASVGLIRTAAAQAPEEPSVGNRIRVKLPDSLRVAPFWRRELSVTGRLVRATPDTLVLHVGGANPLAVSRTSVTELSVSEGSSRARSALSNGFWSGLSMAALRYAIESDARDQDNRRIAIAGGAGFALGALVGALSPFEHWRKVRH